MSSKIGGHDGPRDAYLERIAGECMACKAKVEGRISSASQNPALAEDVVAQAIKQVIQHADRHRGAEKQIENVEAFLTTTARNLLNDARKGKSKADRIETVSWDSAADGAQPTLPDASSAKEIERRIEAAELKELVLKEATPAQRMLFEMLFERDMTPTEISVELRITPAAVRFRINTLVAKMRDAVTKSGLA